MLTGRPVIDELCVSTFGHLAGKDCQGGGTTANGAGKLTDIDDHARQPSERLNGRSRSSNGYVARRSSLSSSVQALEGSDDRESRASV
jgi:hypothetical protein